VKITAKYERLGQYTVARVMILDGKSERACGILDIPQRLWPAVSKRLFDRTEKVKPEAVDSAIESGIGNGTAMAMEIGEATYQERARIERWKRKQANDA